MSTATVGYYKDAAATIAFAIALVFLVTIGIPKSILIISLIACIFVDGMFTINPTWHCSPIGRNPATYMLIAQLVLIIFVATFLAMKSKN